MSQSKIKFERSRPFGDIIGDSIKFTFGHFKSIFGGFLVYAGPFVLISVVSGIFTFDLTSLTSEPDLYRVFGSVSIFALSSMMLGLVLYAYSFAVVQKYRNDPEGDLLDGMFPYVRDITFRLFLVFLAYLVFVAVVGTLFALLFIMAFESLGFVAITILGSLFLFVAVVYVAIPLMLVPYVYINEKVNLVESVQRAFYLVKGKWWSTFGVILIVSMIGSTVSSIVLYPAYIMDFIDALATSDGDLTGYRMSFFLKVSLAVSMFISFFFTILQLVAIAMQYFKLRELKEGASLLDRIDSIEMDD